MTAIVVACGVGGLIAAGAPVPSSARPPTTNTAHWAFVRPGDPTIPENGAAHPIDAFVRVKLNAAGLKPSAPADRPTLIRRLALDLLGLPPTPAEVQAFVDDRRPDAYERLVDRLLASPHFGERWGRHWLDLARYADSDGYEKDTPRPYAYLFRDWVINAINRDQPFDQFTIEQLAGDLLPEPTDAQRVATGFHRQTLINKEGGVDQEEFRCKATVDRTHTTGAAWLGLTLGCAECHDHKYDPISQREFYQLYAFFNQASDADWAVPTADEFKRHAQVQATWAERCDQRERRVLLLEQLAAASVAPTHSPTQPPPPARDAASNHIDRVERVDSPELTQARRELEEHRKAAPTFKPTTAMVLTNQVRTTHVHVRGDFLRPGERVEPGTPAFLPPLRARGPGPDRLDLARWIVSADHPLTARVAANHVWRHLFGRGLVATENDFGRRGEPPSHPELLDWLAREFPRLGWSRKQLIRRIVTSETYRQSSVWRADLAERDPLNVWLARQGRFRLEAEIVRDVALSVSGRLNPRLGGPSFKPVLPRDLADLSYANGLKWEAAAEDERSRRGLYIHFQRTVPYPMLMAFDAPDSTVVCTRRERSNSPLQALTLLNNETFVECARGLGQRMIQRPASALPHPDAAILHGFQLVTGRSPTRAERQRLRQFWRAQAELFAKNPDAARAVLQPPASTPAPSPVAAGTAAASPELSSDQLAQATAVAVARVLLNLEESTIRP